MEYTKLDATTLRATKTRYTPEGETYTEDCTYKRSFLENQITAITEQRDAMIAAKQAELDEVTALLAKCDELGVEAEATI